MRYGLDPEREQPHDDRTAFPVQSSVLDEEALLHRFVAGYAIPEALACRFLSRGDADIYRVTTSGPRYYLKVYRPPYQRAAVEAEAQFVTHLAQGGVPVVAPVPREDGGFASEALASEGTRPMLLFQEAPPTPLSTLDETTCRSLGQELAQLHEVADALEDTYGLPGAQGASAPDTLLPYAKPFLAEEDYAYLEALSASVAARLAELPRQLPDYGLCHGDLVLSNIRLDPKVGVTFFDFGNARYTWRVFELAVVHRSLSQRAPESFTQLWDALLAGYASVRPLPADLPAVLPVMLMLRILSWIGGNAATLPLRLGTEPFEGEIFIKALAAIREIEAEHHI